jgi:hypothetical protein
LLNNPMQNSLIFHYAGNRWTTKFGRGFRTRYVTNPTGCAKYIGRSRNGSTE